MTTITAREFNRDVSAAKRAAKQGPVTITDRGEPAFVLLSIQDYRDRIERGVSLLERLQMSEDVEFEPVVLRGLPRAGEF
ncbi:MAG: type II toxin-antitoxin system Phd/YefM family antitoxin [Actinobacteria bacterium]|nr:type II toxin-antitoxin system Phd/YefM family antitoxin [Actinomycetota bacterium]